MQSNAYVIRRFLLIRISTCLFIALGYYTYKYIHESNYYNYYNTYNYYYVDRKVIDSKLFKKANSAVLKEGRPNCSYSSILQSTRTIHAWEVPKNNDDIAIQGITEGSYAPQLCNPLFSVAIIVTYRNRQKQRNIFISYMHYFLKKQNIHYKIYLVEQQDETPWNKGLLYNHGALQAMKDGFPCLIFHDVDLLPLDESNLYACTIQPRHLSASVDTQRFILPYEWLVGGAVAILSHDYNAINGFSNKFLGWGGEDDDLANRMKMHNMSILRFPREMSRYTMLPHRPQPRDLQPTNLRLLLERLSGDAAAAAEDGLHSMFGAVRSEPRPLYYLIGVKHEPNTQ